MSARRAAVAVAVAAASVAAAAVPVGTAAVREQAVAMVAAAMAAVVGTVAAAEAAAVGIAASAVSAATVEIAAARAAATAGSRLERDVPSTSLAACNAHDARPRCVRAPAGWQNGTAMKSERNPQAEQMAHESMVRNLAAQAEAIWPQERPLFRAYALPENASVLDVGCGTGEIVLRLGREFPRISLVGIDVHEPHLELARERGRALGGRAEFRAGDAFALDFADGEFDLTLCRHMLQAVPEPTRVLAEMKRVTRRGGRLHVVAEDYGMIHCHPCAVDGDRFWREGPITLGQRTGTDLHGGRKAFAWLHALGLVDIRVDYAVIDTQRVERGVLVGIFEAWRDGYTELIAAHSQLSEREVRTSFDAIVAAFRDPAAYGVWLLPILSACVP